MMRSVIQAVILFAGLLVTGCQAQTRPAPPSLTVIEKANDDVVDATVIVVLLRSPAAEFNLLASAGQRGYALYERDRLDTLGLIMLTLSVPRGTSGSAAIAELESIEPTAIAGVNHRYALNEGLPSASETINQRRHFPRLITNWAAEGCPVGHVIGLLDTGVAAEEVPTASIIQKSFLSGSNAGPTQHGTQIARIFVDHARLHTPTLIVAGVFNDDDQGQAESGVNRLVRGLNWLIAQGADIINFSFSGPYNKILDVAVQAAAARGTVMVAAAGNHGPTTHLLYPAAFEDVVAVTAVDASGAIYPSAVAGTHIDIAAPGVDLYLPFNSQGDYVSGTSFASPFVTAALAAGLDPAIPPSIQHVRDLLEKTSVDIGPSGFDPVYGMGLLRAPPPCAAAPSMTTSKNFQFF